MSGFTSDSKRGAIESMDLNKTLDNLKVSEKLAPNESDDDTEGSAESREWCEDFCRKICINSSNCECYSCFSKETCEHMDKEWACGCNECKEKLTLKNVMNNVKVVFSRDDYNPENLLMYFKWNKDDVTNAMKIKDFETCDEEICDTYICDYKKKSLMWIEDVKKAANWKIGEKLYINSLERNEKGSAENRYMVVFSKEKYDCEGRFSVNHSFIVEEDGYAVMEMYNHYPESSNYSSYKSIYTDTFYQSRKMYLRVSSLYNDSICRNFRKERNESNDNFIEEEEEEDKQELSVETLKNISYSTIVEDNYMDITWDNNEEIDNIMEKEYRFHLNDSKKSMMWIEDVKKAANWKKYDRLYIFTKSRSDYNFRASWWYDKDDGTFNDNANIVIEEDGYVLMETRNNYTQRKDFEDKIPYFFFVRVDSFYNSFNRDNLMEEEKAATIELEEKYDGNKLMDIDNLNSNDYNKIMRIFSGEITDESFKYCEENNRSIKSYFFSILEGQWYDCHEDINRGVLLTQAQKRDINNLIVSLSCKENSYFSSEEDDDEKYCVDVLTREHLSIANMSKVLKAFNVSCKGMTDSSVPLEVRRQSLYDTMFKEYNKANQTKKEEVNRLVKTFRRKKSIKKTDATDAPAP